MAECCSRCREKASKGCAGGMRFCYECIASLTGETKAIVSSRRVNLQLSHGRTVIGVVEWVPDFIAARYRRQSQQRER